MKRPFNRGIHAKGQLLESGGIWGLGEGNGDCAPKAFQVVVVLNRVVAKFFQGKRSALDILEKRMIENSRPDVLGGLLEVF